MNNNPFSKNYSNKFHAQPDQRVEIMRLEKPIVCRNCLNKIHKNYLPVSSIYPKNSVMLSYSLATSDYFSEIEGFDFKIALKLRPYGGTIGIDNSSAHKN